MKIESTGFTEEDLKAFLQESVAFERTRAKDDLTLADRLEAASARLTKLVEEMPPGEAGDAESGDEWTSKDVLIHIGLLSGLYAWMTEAIATQAQAEIDLMSFFGLRDVAGAQRLELSVAELLAIAQTELGQAAGFLRSTTPSALQRRARVGPFDLSAEEVARLGLCSHVESHVQQFEIAASRAAWTKR
jgi:hypothetical protein